MPAPLTDHQRVIYAQIAPLVPEDTGPGDLLHALAALLVARAAAARHDGTTSEDAWREAAEYVDIVATDCAALDYIGTPTDEDDTPYVLCDACRRGSEVACSC